MSFSLITAAGSVCFLMTVSRKAFSSCCERDVPPTSTTNHIWCLSLPLAVISTATQSHIHRIYFYTIFVTLRFQTGAKCCLVDLCDFRDPLSDPDSSVKVGHTLTIKLGCGELASGNLLEDIVFSMTK